MDDYSKDTLKKLAYLAVGVFTPEDNKFSEMVDGWIEKGKMTEEEGRKFVADMVVKAQGLKLDFEEKVKEQSAELYKSAHIATTEQIASLESRVKKLEEELQKIKA